MFISLQASFEKNKVKSLGIGEPLSCFTMVAVSDMVLSFLPFWDPVDAFLTVTKG